MTSLSLVAGRKVSMSMLTIVFHLQKMDYTRRVEYKDYRTFLQDLTKRHFIGFV